MTNREKFIQIMNETFDAGFTNKNIKCTCSPCGLMKYYEDGCKQFFCDKCIKWWDKEYKEPKSEAEQNAV